MSFFNGIKNFFIDAYKDVKKDVAAETQLILKALGPMVNNIVKNGGSLLMVIAGHAVAAAEEQGGTGDEKLQAALKSVESDVRTAGIPFVVSAAKDAIEAAVASMNEQKAIAADAATALSPQTVETGTGAIV